MRKNTKKLLLLAAILSAVGFTAAGCDKLGIGGKNNSSDEPIVKGVVFDVEEVLNALPGDYFSIPSPVCLDENGKMYFPTAEVKDPSGNPVVLDSGVFFVAVEGDYTLTYSVKYGEETQKKTVIVRSADTEAPSLTLDTTSLWAIQGQNVQFPTYTVTDSFCETSAITVETAVYYGDEKVTSDATGFVPTNVGEYKIVYKAKDAKNNVSPDAIVTVQCVQSETGNLTYWNTSFGADGVAIPNGNTVEVSNEKTIGTDEYSLKFTLTTAGNYWGNGNVKLNTAYVKDVTSYDKITFSIYSAVDETKNFTPSIYMHNGSAGTSAVRLTPNAWSEIVFYRASGNTWQLEGGTVGIAVTETNISNLMLCFNYGKAESGTNPQAIFYVSTLRAAKSAVIAMPSTLYTNTAFTIPQATLDNSTEGVTQEVYIDGSETAHTESTVTFTTEGTHTFLFKVKKDGVVVDTKKYAVTVNEKGNLTGWNKQIDTSAWTTITSVSASDLPESAQTDAVPGDDYYLCFNHTNDNAAFWCKESFIEKDISQYDEISFWVYSTVKTSVNWRSHATLLSGSMTNLDTWVTWIEANTWTKITFVRQPATSADSNGRTAWCLIRDKDGTGGFIRILETNMDNELDMIFSAAGTQYISTLRGTVTAE